MQEKLLFKAFDYQRFENSKRLQAVIDASHARTSLHKLSDDDLDLVAGGLSTPGSDPKPGDPK